MKEKIRF